MYQFEKIKLVIWDMDETFWEGTISEGTVTIPNRNILLIKQLSDLGIVNSICSKNNWEEVKNKLQENNLLQYFVFPSVNWEAKGDRVKSLIQDMQLRPVNVLFIDDNPSNREEVIFYNAGIMTEGPEILDSLLKVANEFPKKDPEHKRLKQYRILEQKKVEKSNFKSNHEFLLNSDIKVTIGHDCIEHIDRIHDLILRSNQLNFTKVRSSIEELRDLISISDVTTGYVSVADRFGDYGIVGFYAIQNNELIHFTFSCRTLGMGIEQYTYIYIGRPKLTIVGEVISNLDCNELPDWINQSNKKLENSGSSIISIQNLKEHMVLVKGPCDLFQIYPYIGKSDLFDTEFTYTTDNGLVVESAGHTTNIVQSYILNETQKKAITDKWGFLDTGIYSDRIFKNNYKIVFLSILTDANLGVYKRKKTGEQFAFMEYLHPLTDPKSWDSIIAGKVNTCGYHFKEEELQNFANEFEFVGRNTPEQIVKNLKFIKAHLSRDCVLAIMLGGELNYEKNTFEAYSDRHVVHKRVNDAIRKWAAEEENVELVDVNKYLTDQSCFYDHFNHYIKPIYYSLAQEMVQLINNHTGADIHEKSKLIMIKIKLKETIAPFYYRLKGILR